MTGIFSSLKSKLFAKKEAINSREVSKILLHQVYKITKDDFMKEVHTSASNAEISLKSDELDNIRGAVLIITFWICVHALEHDDQNLTNILYHEFLDEMEKRNVNRDDLEDSIKSHFAKYNSAWANWEKNPEASNGLLFGYEILCGIFNAGLPDKRFLDPLLSLQITNFVVSVMKSFWTLKAEIDKRYEFQNNF